MSDNRQKLQAFSHWAIVLVFLLAFLSLGFRALKEMQLHRMIKDEPGALRAALAHEASTDGYIRELLAADVAEGRAVSRPTEAIRAALAELPPEGAVLFVAPRKLPRYEVMFLVVKTLCLPRSINLVWCDDPKPVQPIQGEKIVAMMFYLVSPPAGLSGVKTIIPQLAIAPVSESTKWTSYCSQ